MKFEIWKVNKLCSRIEIPFTGVDRLYIRTCTLKKKNSHGRTRPLLSSKPLKLSLKPTHGRIQSLSCLKIQLLSQDRPCDGCVADAEFPQLNRTPTNLPTTGRRLQVYGVSVHTAYAQCGKWDMEIQGAGVAQLLWPLLCSICGIQTYANFKSIDYFIMPVCICWP